MGESQAGPRAPLSLQALLIQAKEVIASARDASSAPSAHVHDVTSGLRTQLAVRGWVNPHRLLPEFLSNAETTRVLNAVAVETDSAFALRPGEWFLSNASRRRVLVARGIEALRAELDVVRWKGDADDPIRAAFRLALALDPMPLLSALPDEILRALANVLDWLGTLTTLPLDRERIAGELALRGQRGDIARMTALPMVGKVHQAALRELNRRLGGPPGRGLSATYIHGWGGAGKSTLLAFLQRDLAARSQSPAIVRLDFDAPAINPIDPVSLDIALFDQLGRIFPERAGRFSDIVSHLREQRRFQRDAPAPRVRPDGPHRKMVKPRAETISLAAESADTGAQSERQSIIYGALAPSSIVEMRLTLVIILDTVEVVMTRGEAATLEVVGWLHSIYDTMGYQDVRVVIAGRDPPAGPDGRDLLAHLTEIATVHPPIALCDLDEDEGAELLANYGVTDQAVARTAAAAVPRNPLLLRIVADALGADEALAAEVRTAHREARVDAPSARTYLARRIVAHLADPVARPYLLAAMYLPSITRPQLRDILIPTVDGAARPAGRRTVERVFRALRSARWLSRPGGDPRIFSFHRDVRALVRMLLAADQGNREMELKLRRRAVAVHEAARTSRDRAYGLYHRALLGENVPALRGRETVLRHLEGVLDDLPEVWRNNLQGTARPIAGRHDFVVQSSSEEWRLYLEGTGSKDGEGARLLKRDRAAQALQFYRERPTQRPGAPPTFVIRALADLGEWHTEEVDDEAILDEAEYWLAAKRLSGAAMSRLYWLTRFGLLRDEGELSPRHASILADSCEKLAGATLSTIPALVAVAEARRGEAIMSDRMRGGRGAIESVTRVHLVNARQTRRPVDFKPHVDALVVVQRDWSRRIMGRAAGMIDVTQLQWAQNTLDSLNEAPLGEMNRRLNTLRRPVRVTWDGDDIEAGILLLRGQTTEFLRPVRQALLDLHARDGTRAWVGDLLRGLIGRMSIRPRELQSDLFFKHLARDPGAWLAAIVGFADRSRLLPYLCDALASLPGNDPQVVKARNIARSFLAWDLAICDGLRSGWSGETRSR